MPTPRTADIGLAAPVAGAALAGPGPGPGPGLGHTTEHLPRLAQPGRTVAVAFSGGPDSLALLHATCRAARALQLQVLAIHVHHGLLPQADAWLQRAQDQVARWRRRGWPVQLAWACLAGAPSAGDSIEAWARAGRHAALNRLAQAAGASLLLLGQHQRDQAETVLLQLLRGAGPPGLAAMPRQVRRAGLVWARPWLDQPREALLAYLARHRLRPVQDPSNADLRLGRARLRAQLWPALLAGFPGAEPALAQAARRAQEADAALAELAALDLAACTVPIPASWPALQPTQMPPHVPAPWPVSRLVQTTASTPPAGQPEAPAAIAVPAWRCLSPARQANALRAWWWQHTGTRPPDTLVQRLLQQVPAAGSARWPAAGGWVVAVYRQRLTLHRVAVAMALASGPAATPARPEGPAAQGLLNLARAGWHPLPAWGGGFWVQACTAGGLLPAQLQAVQVQARQGGEQWQAAPRSLPRSLKKQFQAAGVPAGQRQGPLLWQGAQLLLVPGLGVDARAAAPAGPAQLCPHWCVAEPGHTPDGVLLPPAG